jgi:hypothetical protein
MFINRMSMGKIKFRRSARLGTGYMPKFVPLRPKTGEAMQSRPGFKVWQPKIC